MVNNVIRDFYHSAAAYLTVRAMDIGSTTLALSKPGVEELNPVTDYFIENYGLIQGQAAKEVLFSGVALGLAHKINKLQRDHKTRLPDECGTKSLQVVTVFTLPVIVNNLIVYFS